MIGIQESDTDKKKAKKKAYEADYQIVNRVKIAARKAACAIVNREKISKYNAAYAVANKERRAAYRASNKERLAISVVAYRIANKSRIAARVARYAAANRNKIAIYHVAYLAANPERYRRAALTRRSRKLNASVGDPALITKWEKAWKAKRFVICYWCSKRVMTKTCHSDHIHPLSRGGEHSVENLVVSCAACNLRKSASSLDTWNDHIAEPILL